MWITIGPDGAVFSADFQRWRRFWPGRLMAGMQSIFNARVLHPKGQEAESLKALTRMLAKSSVVQQWFRHRADCLKG